MEKRVQLEMRTMKPDQIEELILDNCRSTTIVGLTDDFVNLETLSLINVGLTSLKGFPKLPNLKKLELSDNRISGGLNLLHTSPKLSHLNLSGNKIGSLEALEPLKEFKNLKSLDLFNNEATQISNYRELIFDLIPSLKFLDGFDAEDREAEDSEGEDDEVNGNDEDSEECDDDEEDGLEDEEEEDLDEDDEVGLDAVYKDNLEEESDGDDYDGEAGEEEDDDVLDDEEEDGEDAAEDGAEADGAEDEEEAEGAAEEASQTRGKKRKHEGEEVN
ncbi:acidic leucine-rich nuclear phosphoprotein 32 family member A [Frankliniella occidentalis]|uniref:Acidic leucine-rich nuclear phosphoprotein 32 family member A n=1 Tax=Frankliniella occidentalis TaxID=133901 RepID=A0A6J1SBY2_FRAOC|nr:acidic leucine-rich nuclear phosphoprotein 32 family member A [Frankliniella occidentalis]